MIFGLMLSYGSYISYFSIINQCLKKIGFENPNKVVSYSIIGLSCTGILSTILFSNLIRKKQKYKFILSMRKNIFI